MCQNIICHYEKEVLQEVLNNSLGLFYIPHFSIESLKNLLQNISEIYFSLSKFCFFHMKNNSKQIPLAAVPPKVPLNTASMGKILLFKVKKLRTFLVFYTCCQIEHFWKLQLLYLRFRNHLNWIKKIIWSLKPVETQFVYVIRKKRSYGIAKIC